MGYTYKKEKSFDDRNSKKRLAADVQRKQNKHRVRDVLYEDGEDIEFDDFEEYYEPTAVQHNRQK